MPLLIIAVPIALVVRVVRPILLVRIGTLVGSRIGHFGGNTELYCCEVDEGLNRPDCRYIDLFCCPGKICNKQLLRMWRRVLYIYPSWLLLPVRHVLSLFPGGYEHKILLTTNSDRDVHNLVDKYQCHIGFTESEMNRGYDCLKRLGVPYGAPYVFLHVRDSAYLDSYLKGDWSYHSYRNSDISNYVLACEALAERGYYVIRAGVNVQDPLITSSQNVIDYASSGLRSEFMDIWLGAHCTFCIGVGSGVEVIPYIFRRPIALVNLAPFGYFPSFSRRAIGIFKHHFRIEDGRELTLDEIVGSGVHLALHTSAYAEKGIELKENTPEEIRDLVLEMADRIEGIWTVQPEDSELQDRFWELFPSNAKSVDGVPLHGDIRARFGAAFLRQNQGWLQGTSKGHR